MNVVELFKSVVVGSITEAEFMQAFFKLLRDPELADAEAQCLNELVDDVNMAEHVRPLFERSFVWRVEECLRLLTAGSTAFEVRTYFAKHRGPY